MLSLISLLAAIAAVLLQISMATTINGLAEGESSETGRIIDGQEAFYGQFPWVAALFSNGRFVCTCSILSPSTVLTAAHCVVTNGVTESAGMLHAIANNKKSSKTVRIDFVSVTPHPDYSDRRGITDDIAILTTSQPIPFDDNVQPICIARKDTAMMKYRNATAMGWGDTSRNRWFSRIPDVLQYIELKIVPNSKCRLGYFGIAKEDSKMCAGFLNGICKGDSGGPLVYLSADKPAVEIGVASYINAITGCGFLSSGVWTRVSHYHDWIMENSAGNYAICTV